MYDKNTFDKAQKRSMEAREAHLAGKHSEAIALCLVATHLLSTIEPTHGKIPQIDQAHRQTALIQAAAHFALENYANAARCWSLYEPPKGFEKTWRKKAFAHMQLKEPGEALRSYKQIEKPTDDDLRNMLACIEQLNANRTSIIEELLARSQQQARLSQFDAAKVNAQTVLQIEPGNRDARGIMMLVEIREKADLRRTNSSSTDLVGFFQGVKRDRGELSSSSDTDSHKKHKPKSPTK